MYEAIALEALKLINGIMEHIPNYEQRKIEKFHRLREELESESKKPYGVRNDKLVLDLSDELRLYVEDFSKILSESGMAGVRKS